MKWGVIGAGNLMRRMGKSFAALKNQGVEIYAVAARSPEDVEKKKQLVKAEVYYDSYDKLLADPEVEIVYIPTQNLYHKDCAIKALKAGKPVLLEKPFTITGDEAQEIMDCARENNVFCMEGMWTRCMPAVKKAKAWIDEGRIGSVRQLYGDIGWGAGIRPFGRLYAPNAGGGAFYDGGIYCLSIAYYLMGGQDPVDFATMAEMYEPTDVDVHSSTILRYADGAHAVMMNGIDTTSRQDIMVYGTEGVIIIESPFWKATKAVLNRYDGTHEEFEFVPAEEGFEFELLEVERCVKEGLKESPIMPLEESVRIMRLVDKMQAAWRK